MQIVFKECVGMNGGLFQDLADYPWIDNWMVAILNSKSQFKPVDVKITYEDDMFVIMQDGHPTEDAFKRIHQIGGFPARVRRIPHQRMYIQVDGFERTLDINLDCKSLL